MKCPEKYCFHWVSIEDKHLPYLYKNIYRAYKTSNKTRPVKKGYCGCSFGVCARLDIEKNNKDWYEPHEPQLEKNGLSHNHFINDNP